MLRSGMTHHGLFGDRDDDSISRITLCWKTGRGRWTPGSIKHRLGQALHSIARRDKLTASHFRLKRDELGNMLTFVKGIAILFVMMHHFARSAWLSLGIEPPLLLQWEYIYPLESYHLLYSALLDGNYWEASLRALASGYFEFHLFILASGLGLALGTPEKIGVWALFRQRAAKIIPPFWLAVIVFASLAWLAGHGYSINQIVARMLMLTTFSGKDFFTIDSPLWCIALFLQLYLLFIPLRAVINRFGLNCIPALVAIAFLARWCASLPEVMQWNVHFGHVFAQLAGCLRPRHLDRSKTAARRRIRAENLGP